jgi:hypothetical protein
MKRNVLYIDDQPDKRVVEELEKELQIVVNENSHISLELKVHVVNPLDYLTLEQGQEVYSDFFNYLDKNFLYDTLDLVMCDFNIHAKHKHISFHIIDHVRKMNKACSIILYSGSPLKELMRMNNDDLAESIFEHIKNDNPEVLVDLLSKKLEEIRKKETPAEELLSKAVLSNITDIVSRKHHEESAYYRISNPSLLLIIEHELLSNGKIIFKDGSEALDGLSFEEVASEVRLQSEKGVKFTKLIIELSLDNICSLNFN